MIRRKRRPTLRHYPGMSRRVTTTSRVRPKGKQINSWVLTNGGTRLPRRFISLVTTINERGGPLRPLQQRVTRLTK